jgi:hypothetical protein
VGKQGKGPMKSRDCNASRGRSPSMQMADAAVLSVVMRSPYRRFRRHKAGRHLGSIASGKHAIPRFGQTVKAHGHVGTPFVCNLATFQIWEKRYFRESEIWKSREGSGGKALTKPRFRLTLWVTKVCEIASVQPCKRRGAGRVIQTENRKLK